MQQWTQRCCLKSANCSKTTNLWRFTSVLKRFALCKSKLNLFWKIGIFIWSVWVPKTVKQARASCMSVCFWNCNHDSCSRERSIAVENAYYQITADLVYDNTDTLHDNSKQAESISFVQKNMCIDLISVTGKKKEMTLSYLIIICTITKSKFNPILNR